MIISITFNNDKYSMLSNMHCTHCVCKPPVCSVDSTHIRIVRLWNRIWLQAKHWRRRRRRNKTAGVEHTGTLATTSQNNSEQHSDNAAKTFSLIHFSFDLRDVYTHRTWLLLRIHRAPYILLFLCPSVVRCLFLSLALFIPHSSISFTFIPASRTARTIACTSIDPYGTVCCEKETESFKKKIRRK